jgi:hypothetical protein
MTQAYADFAGAAYDSTSHGIGFKLLSQPPIYPVQNVKRLIFVE